LARRQFPPRKSEKVWIELQPNAAESVVTASTLIGVLNAAALALRPFTILRSRLLLHVQSDQAAATEFTAGSIGMIVSTEAASTAGIGSLPTPNTEADAAWFVWQAFSHSFAFFDATGTNEPAGSSYEIDSKAMRKVGLDDQVNLIGQVVTTPGAALFVNGRMLVQLH